MNQLFAWNYCYGLCIVGKLDSFRFIVNFDFVFDACFGDCIA